MARCHGSDLLTLRLPLVHEPAVVLLEHRRRCGRVAESGRDSFSFPDSKALVVRLSASLVRRVFTFGKPPEHSVPCWLTVATVHSPSDCDSLKAETSLELLDPARNGFSSCLAARFLLRDRPAGARTPPKEPVNPASAPGFASGFERGQIRQPDPAFTQSPGLILSTVGADFRLARDSLCSFNELQTDYKNPRS